MSPVQREPPDQRLARRLRARIARRYRTVVEVLRIGALEIPFTRIAQPDRVLDQIIEEEDRHERTTGIRKSGEELHLPYWAELWDSALGIGQHLIEHPELCRGECLDLGCGMGLAGTVAAALGARVMLADLETPALLFARLNSLAYRSRVRVRRLDWRSDRLEDQFHLILGSDVLYERMQWDFLEPFWRAHLCEGARVVLAEPGRQTGEIFPDWIAARGWSVTRSERPVATREQPIRIFELRLRDAIT